MDIEAVIAQATDVAPESKATEPTPEVAETSETPQKEDVKEVAKPKPDSELTPEQLAKREANRQSHLNSKLAKMRRENRELRELANRSQQQQAKPPETDNGAPKPPNEDDYASWDELRAAERKYYEDLADWRIEQKLSERDKKTTEQTQAKQVDSYKAERINELATKEAEFAKQHTDYEQVVYGDYSDFMSNLPLPVAEALLEAENASLALYALAKEGRLEQLEDMSPYRISMEIGKAEIRGEQYLNRNTVTNAPDPVRAARGTGNVGKSLEQKSVEELLAQFNS